MPSDLFFLLKTVLIVQDLLLFHVNFRIVFPISVQNATGILVEIALNL